MVHTPFYREKMAIASAAVVILVVTLASATVFAATPSPTQIPATGTVRPPFPFCAPIIQAGTVQPNPKQQLCDGVELTRHGRHLRIGENPKEVS